MSTLYFLDPAELARQDAIDAAKLRYLTNHASIDAAFVTIANIAARAELLRVRRALAAKLDTLAKAAA